MTTRTTDPLLLTGKILSILLQVGMVIGGIALSVALPALLIFRTKVESEFASQSGAAAVTFPLLQLAGVMAIGLAIVVLLFVFFDKLRRIINTVGDGDPFQPLNATRLAIMGWLMLAVQLLLLPATALGMQLAELADEAEGMNFTSDGGLDMTGILLTIILFILARVFRHGAAMRDELEGTV